MNILIFTVWPVEFWRVPKSQVQRLRERFPQVNFMHAVTDAEAISAIESADVALASRLSSSMPEHAPRLRWAHSTAAAVGIRPWSVLGRRMTIVGFGTTGQEVARRAHAFGMRVIGIRRRVNQPKPEFVDRIAGPGELDEVLQGCDVLVIAAPFIAETDGLIGSE